MSLTDGRAKMSKSALSDASRINLLDEEDLIRKKIKSCKTDDVPGIEWDNPDRPEATNLLNIYQAVTGLSRESILAEVADLPWGTFKPILADAVINHLRPIQAKYKQVREDEGYLENVLKEGAMKANGTARRTADHCRLAMGFLPEFK